MKFYALLREASHRTLMKELNCYLIYVFRDKIIKDSNNLILKTKLSHLNSLLLSLLNCSTFFLPLSDHQMSLFNLFKKDE